MFAQHMLVSLKQTGKMAVVMPHGVLFRGGEEKEIRIGPMKENCIEAVIGLPQNHREGLRRDQRGATRQDRARRQRLGPGWRARTPRALHRVRAGRRERVRCGQPGPR
jgi:hypothetical protein